MAIVEDPNRSLLEAKIILLICSKS